MAQSNIDRPKPGNRSVQVGSDTWLRHNHISSFVRILHLLDLDLREDWPNITVQTFSTRSPLQSLQQRIRAVEWSLYRLIELYDRHLARDKLQPFFPPQSPLQSQNLRAALLRVLSDLKNVGILSRDTLLRKSTFDECKGDQFERLLSNLAQCVLQKCSTTSPRHSMPGTYISSANVLPLLISYEASLSKTLQRRREVSSILRRQEHDSLNTRAAISEKRAWLERCLVPDIDHREAVKSLIAASWTGEMCWKDVLLVESPLQQAVSNGEENTGSGPQQQLQQKIRSQEIYLKRLEGIRESLLPPSVPNPPTPAHQSIKKTPLLRFDKHLSLHETNIQDELQATMSDSTVQRRSNDLVARLESELHQTNGQMSIQPNEVQTPSSGHSSTRLEILPPSEGANVSSECSWIIETPAAGAKHAAVSAPGERQLMSNLHLTSSKDKSLQLSLAERTRSSLAGVKGRTKGFDDSSSPARHQDPKNGDGGELDYKFHENTLRTDQATRRCRNGQPFVLKPESPALPTVSPLTPGSGDNLSERTRKSMALLSKISDIRAGLRISPTSRTSQLYPVNPFETPRKPHVQKSLQTPQSSGSTPRDTLFSDDADVTSVFKSRPKIAVSPPLSPNRDMHALAIDDLQSPRELLDS